MVAARFFETLISSKMTPTDPPSPRPLSVWLLMLALLAGGVPITVSSARFFWFFASHLAEVRNFMALAIEVVWHVATVVVILAVLFGIFHRRQWGRWLGLLSIAAFAVITILAPDATTYANDAQKAGGFLGRTIFAPLMFTWWGYAFGFSKKAKRYFSR